jgi:hypothetical protein
VADLSGELARALRLEFAQEKSFQNFCSYYVQMRIFVCNAVTPAVSEPNGENGYLNAKPST